MKHPDKHFLANIFEERNRKNKRGLTANEFSTIITSFVRSQLPLPDHANKLVLYSDGCCYKNRNTTSSNALLHVAMTNNVVIVQKHLEKGDTQMEVNSMHATIERQLKHNSINVPADYVHACTSARKNPCHVVKPGRKAGEPTVTDLRALRYCPDGNIINKLRFSENYWTILPNRMTRNQYAMVLMLRGPNYLTHESHLSNLARQKNREAMLRGGENDGMEREKNMGALLYLDKTTTRLNYFDFRIVGLSGGVIEIESGLADKDLRAVVLKDSFFSGRGDIPCKPPSVIPVSLPAINNNPTVVVVKLGINRSAAPWTSRYAGREVSRALPSLQRLSLLSATCYVAHHLEACKTALLSYSADCEDYSFLAACKRLVINCTH
ncbi:hypothetical protein PR048_024715 [Dryococelus australis]|uniref:Piwi domain-containing protein n=1 Tax=Dryococelus australis TaxID=614101 RepID=A0ABQ9GPE8_9NEOP|nr:hypothetical protein PR048_024715 [Dryococelus australis]